MTTADTLDTDILTFLKRHESKELLRFVAVGSVDDGKSTLIGRLLYDTNAVYDDQLEDAGKDGEVDLARITDGLRAEREQGITIDVAYRYFTTPRRKFIIADTPGHVQYTRNMATGASTAHVAIILIDARYGVLQQSRRHAYIASLLGIPHLVVAVNKMDLVDYDQARYEAIRDEFLAFAEHLGFRGIHLFPISALVGDNIVHLSENTPWYDGGTILDLLETVDVVDALNLEHFRFPVQYVLRPNLDYRGFAGQIASGRVAPGDAVRVLPSGRTSRVRAIDTWEGELESAFAPQSVVLRLEDEIDVSRGDVLVHADASPRVARSFRAHLVWMSERPLTSSNSWLLKHGTRYVRADLTRIVSRMDLESMTEQPSEQLQLNDIGQVDVVAHRAIVHDPYRVNRALGAFIVIDPMTNATVAAGMIAEALPTEELDVSSTSFRLDARARARRLGHSAGIVRLQPPEAFAPTFLWSVERRLFELGAQVIALDGVSDEQALGETARTAELLRTAGLVVLTTDELPVSDSHAILAADEPSADEQKRTFASSGDEVRDVDRVVQILRDLGLAP